jgi:acyl transferase domain-containing protein/acyl carrier protein
MDDVESEFIERVARVDTRRATLAMYSTILSECVDGKELDVRYWARNARGTLDFAGAMFAAIRDGYQLFMEIGPHAELVPHIQNCLDFRKISGLAIASLQKQRGDCRALLESAGALYTRGCALEWSRVVPAGGRCVPLPTYPWQRERHWLDLNEGAPHITKTEANPAPTKVVFVFPGQGSQWPGMALQLLDTEPVFRATMGECDAAIHQEAGFSVLRELQANKSDAFLKDIDVVQPTLFAIEVALAATWRAKGVEPSCVIGHSMGEVAAAYVAGMLSLADAAKVICQRSRLLKRISGKGAMAVVEMSMNEAETFIAGHERELAVAVSNSARSTVLSGNPEALDEVLARLDALGIFNRRVKVDVASHCPQVDPLHADLLSALTGIQPMPGKLRMQSTVTGDALRGSEVGAEYWWENLRQPVRFSQVTRDLLHDGFEIYLELSPHPILITSIEENLRNAGDKGIAIPSMRRDTDERQTMLDALSAVYAHGYVNAQAARNTNTNTLASKDPYDKCIFEVAWTERGVSPPRMIAPGSLSTPWLVVADARGFGTTIAKQLRQRGDRVLLVTHGSSFNTITSDDYRLDLLDRMHWNQLFERANLTAGCRGVISCTALDAATWPETSEATLAHDLRQGPWTTLRLVQNLLQRGWRDAPRLYILTRGAQTVTSTDGAPSVVQATIWGLGRVVAMEEPDLGCHRIDLPANATASDVEWLLREIDGSDNEHEDQVALRPQGRFVARLERGHWNKVENSQAGRLHPIRPQATYLITGGLGGLGLQLAQWMVEQGAESIVLVGRNAPNEQARTTIAQLETRGARIHVLSVDVADRAAVDALMSEIDENMPPLRGVVHAAVVLDDRTVGEMNEDTFFRPMGAKVFGGWNLHRATRYRNLDFFVMYSSMAALVGSPGQANYAAANSFLDSLCLARRAEGLPATSIQWGAFADVGLAAAADIRGKRLAARGSASFKPEEGFALFARAIRESRSVVGIMHFDVRQWVQFYPQVAGHSFLSQLTKEDAQAATTTSENRAFRDVFEQIPAKERIVHLENHVREQLGQVLRVRSERIDKDTPFANLGMDSLMSLELRNKLEASLGLKLSAALLYTYATTNALARYLIEQIYPSAKKSENVITDHSAPGDLGDIAESERVLDEDDSTLMNKLEAFEEYLT